MAIMSEIRKQMFVIIHKFNWIQITIYIYRLAYILKGEHVPWLIFIYDKEFWKTGHFVHKKCLYFFKY